MNDVTKSQKVYFVDLKVQVLCMFITAITALVIFYASYKGFKSVDEYPPIISLTPQKIFELGGPGSPIHTGIFIKNFAAFDIIKSNFLVDLTLWFKFSPDHIALEVVDKFVIQKAEIKSKSAPFVKVEDDNLLVSYDMRVQFYGSLNYKNFPLDDHRLSVIVDNYFISPAQAFFVTSNNNIVVSSEIQVEGWKLTETAIGVGFFKRNVQDEKIQETVYYPRSIFFFDFTQAGARNIFSIFLPLLLIFFTALLSFSINPLEASFHKAVDMSGGSLAAIIAYRFIMESFSPTVGYFMLSDYIYLFFLVVVVFILLVNMFGRRVTGFQKLVIIICLHVTTIAVFVYLLRPWV